MTNQMVLKQNNKMYFYFTCTIEVYPGEEIGKELHQIKRYVTFTQKEIVLFMEVSFPDSHTCTYFRAM